MRGQTVQLGLVRARLESGVAVLRCCAGRRAPPSTMHFLNDRGCGGAASLADHRAALPSPHNRIRCASTRPVLSQRIKRTLAAARSTHVASCLCRQCTCWRCPVLQAVGVTRGSGCHRHRRRSLPPPPRRTSYIRSVLCAVTALDVDLGGETSPVVKGPQCQRGALLFGRPGNAAAPVGRMSDNMGRWSNLARPVAVSRCRQRRAPHRVRPKGQGGVS